MIDLPGSTIFNMEFTFLSGFEFIDNSKYEVPHLMEHLILGSNKYYKSMREFTREFEVNGAINNAYTDDALNGYYAESADFEWDRIMKLMWQGLTTPQFAPREFKTERETVEEELTSKKENHQIINLLALEQAMGKDYMKSYSERLAQLPSITPEDMRAHYQLSHSAANMRFVVAGDMSEKREDVEKLIERYSSRLPEGERKIRPAGKMIAPLGTVITKRSVDKIYFTLRMGSYGELTEREMVALQFVAYILTDSWDSRIFGKGREKGLLYHISSSGGNSTGYCSLAFHGSVIPSKVDKLFRFLAGELNEFINKGITEKELKDAKQYALGSFQIRYQTAQHLVNWYSRFFTRDDVYSFTDRADLIKSITRNDVDRVVAKVMQTETWGLAVLGKNLSDKRGQKFHDIISKAWQG